MLFLHCTSKFSTIHKEILEFLNFRLARLLEFSQFIKRLFFQVVSNSLKSWDIGIFKVSLILYFADCEDSLRHGMFVGERGDLI